MTTPKTTDFFNHGRNFYVIKDQFQLHVFQTTPLKHEVMHDFKKVKRTRKDLSTSTGDLKLSTTNALSIPSTITSVTEALAINQRPHQGILFACPLSQNSTLGPNSNASTSGSNASTSSAGTFSASSGQGTSNASLLFAMVIVQEANKRNHNNKTVFVYDLTKSQEICSLSFRETITGVMFYDDKLLVSMAGKTYLYSYPNLKCLHEVNTFYNPNGLLACAEQVTSNVQWFKGPQDTIVPMSPEVPVKTDHRLDLFLPTAIKNDIIDSLKPNGGSKSGFETVDLKTTIALPTLTRTFVYATLGTKSGQIRVSMNEKKTHLIDAHEHDISLISFNPDGTIIVTASAVGTTIKVFSCSPKPEIEIGQLLHTFRRGSDAAVISSVSFSFDSNFVVSSSRDKNTVHLFSITRAAVENSPQPAQPQVQAQAQALATATATATATTTSTATNTSTPKQPDNNTSTLWFLRGVLPKYFSSEWSFAKFYIPKLTEDPTATVTSTATDHGSQGCIVSFIGNDSTHVTVLSESQGQIYRIRVSDSGFIQEFTDSYMSFIRQYHVEQSILH